MSPVCFVTQVLSTLRSSAPRARKGFPQSSALRLCRPSPFPLSLLLRSKGGDTPPPCTCYPPPSPGGVRHVCHMPLPRQRQQRTQGGRKHEQNIRHCRKAQHLPDRYRPHYSEPQSWRCPVGEALAEPAFHRWPVSPQFPYWQTLSRHQCSAALVQFLRIALLAHLQTGAGVERDRAQRRKRHTDCFLQAAAQAEGRRGGIGHGERTRSFRPLLLHGF